MCELDEYLRKDKLQAIHLGSPLARYAIVSSETGEKTWFVLTIHHSIYDDGPLPLVKQQVEQAYREGAESSSSAPPPGFNLFVKHVLEERTARVTAPSSTGRPSSPATTPHPFPRLPAQAMPWSLMP